MVRANALLLSVAAQFNDPIAVEIMKWLNDTTIILGSNDEKIWSTDENHSFRFNIFF